MPSRDAVSLFIVLNLDIVRSPLPARDKVS